MTGRVSHWAAKRWLKWPTGQPASKSGRVDSRARRPMNPPRCSMLSGLRSEVPLFCGGSANVGNVSRLLSTARVSSWLCVDVGRANTEADVGPKEDQGFRGRAKGHTA